MSVDFAAFSPVVTHVLPEPNYTAGWYAKNILTLHDIESPPGLDWAESLGGPNYLQNPAEQVSVHFVVDGDSIVQGRDIHDWAWHCGTPGSKPSVGIEQAGYASFTRSQWLGAADAIGSSYQRPDGSSQTFTAADASSMAGQIDVMAGLFLALSKALSIDLRWLQGRETNTAVNDPTVTGWNRHSDMSNYLDNTSTSHHDTGDSYPCDVLLAKVQALAAGRPVVIIPPVPPPPVQDGFTMATLPELKALLAPMQAQLAPMQAQLDHLTTFVDGNPPQRNGAANRMVDLLGKAQPVALVSFIVGHGRGVGIFGQGWYGVHDPAEMAELQAAFAHANLKLPDLGVISAARVGQWFGAQSE